MKEILVSDKLILFNLHNAALKKCDIASSNSKVKDAFDDKVINTGVNEKAKSEKDAFKNPQHLYEIGLVCDLSKLKDFNGKNFVYKQKSKVTKAEDVVSDVYGISDNKLILDKVDLEAYNIIIRYMKTFVGSSNCNNIRKDKIEKIFYSSKDNIKISKFAFEAEAIKQIKTDNVNDSKKNENSVNYLLYKIAYTVGIKNKA